MAKNKKIILEDTFDDLFSSATISEDELMSRKIQLGRVLEETELAIVDAQNQGKDRLVVTLQDYAEMLQELLDRADEIPPRPPKEDEVKPGESGSKDSDDDGSSEDDSPRGKENNAGRPGDSKSSTKDKKPDNPDNPDKPGKEPGKEPGKDPGKEPGKDPSKKPDKDPGKEPPKEPPKPPKEPPKEPPEPPREPPEPPEPPREPPEPPRHPPEPPREPPEPPREPPDDPKYPPPPPPPEKPDDPEDPDEPLKRDPFKKPPPPEPPDPTRPPRKAESVLDAAKRILSGLDGDARRGAVDGVKQLLSGHGIHEAYTGKLTEKVDKLISEMSSDEFSELMANVMDTVGKVRKVTWSDDLDVRAKKIAADSMSAVKRAEMEREDADHVKADKDAIRAHERERAKFDSMPGLKGLEAFKASLYKAIKDQVDLSDEEDDSWAALDRRHEDDPSLFVKGKIRDDDEARPSVYVYFDQSGSWSDADIEIGMRAISVINEFHKRGEIKLKVFYMSAVGVTSTAAAARADGRAEGWYAALSHIKGSKAKNVVILSDRDLDSYEDWNRPYGDSNGITRVDGMVWWLWKNGSVSKKALKELRGRKGSMQFRFEGGSRW